MKLLLVTMLFLLSCSVHKTRKNFVAGEIAIDGGSYQNLEWKDEMKFKRYSWFNEASMKYDILLSELKNSSKFATWMGRDRSKLLNCRKLLVGLVYTDINAKYGKPYLISQFEKFGYGNIVMVDFNSHFEAHHSFKDWQLSEHKIVGFCKKDDNSKNVEIDIPGFGVKELK